MNKTPYFLRNDDGTFTFLGYFSNVTDAMRSDERTRIIEVVDASFLYRTAAAANEALNNMPPLND